MTSRSYFDKMNSTLGSVVHLAMFDWHITLQILLEDIHLLKLGLTGSCGKDTVRRVQFLLRTSALSSGWILLVKYGYSLGWLIDCCNCISVYLQLLVCIFDPKNVTLRTRGPKGPLICLDWGLLLRMEYYTIVLHNSLGGVSSWNLIVQETDFMVLSTT